MDENPNDDFILNVKKPQIIKENYVGGRLKEFDIYYHILKDIKWGGLEEL